MGCGEFVAVFGHIFEHSDWITARVWSVGLTSRDDTVTGLFSSFVDVIEGAGREPQLRLLRAHPELAGRVARRENLTGDSRKEQAKAGLQDCSQEEFTEFHELNRLYNDKFGFPFILAVRDRNREEILEIFRRRLLNEEEDEFAEALQQVYRIGYLRLHQIE